MTQAMAPPEVMCSTTVSALVVASSTGGPNALQHFFEPFPGSLKQPIFVVQHMPPLFTQMLAERLSAKTHLKVAEAREGEPVLPGRVYLAPGDYHMEIQGNPKNAKIHLHQGPRENSCRPAADVMFRSAARVYGAGCLGVVMTGMGSDGCLGAQQIHQSGGEIVIQDEASCAVYGMPRAVVEAHIPHEVYPLNELGKQIVGKLQGGTQWATA